MRAPAGPVRSFRLAAFLSAALAIPACADYLNDLAPHHVPPFSTMKEVFPNWERAPVAAFSLVECDDAVCAACPTSTIVGVTMLNYGTASGGAGGDIPGLYFQIVCGTKTDSGTMTMTYAGEWTISAATFPAWTWAGAVGWGSDPCDPTTDGCSCYPSLYVYADIGPCPADGATVAIGPGCNAVLNPATPGGVYDSCGGVVPFVPVTQSSKPIRYVSIAASGAAAAPGDTISYTIHHGRPGTGSLSSVVVLATLPDHTHYVPDSAVPSADAGWRPSPLAPQRLRWTVPGPLDAAGGPTGSVEFKVTVDWGDTFDPQAGWSGAPEGAVLRQAAFVSWEPAGCASGRAAEPQDAEVVHCWLWFDADNDLLGAPVVGQADDEMGYAISVANRSGRALRDVELWDTVPAELDPWGPGLGLYDACQGYTMTPTGCAAAGPGRLLTGPKGEDTLLTWRFDIAPGQTATVRWKARLKRAAVAGDTVTNVAAFRPSPWSAQVRTATHEAPVIVRTAYVAYDAWAASAGGLGCSGQTFWMSFYPLNRHTNFELYKREHENAGVALVGGVSDSIDVSAGNCGSVSPDWIAGCGIGRRPAEYRPAAYGAGQEPALPFVFLHKLVANYPVVWEVSTCLSGSSADSSGYVGMGNLSFAGYVGYTYCRVQSYPDLADTLLVVNTSEALSTDVVVSAWDSGTAAWRPVARAELAQESQWAFVPPAAGHYRVASGVSPVIVHKAYAGIGVAGGYADFGSLAPNRENGRLVSDAVPATFYLWAGSASTDPHASVVVGNVGGSAAAYEIWRYAPVDPGLPSPSPSTVTPHLVGTAGSWVRVGAGTADPGLTGASNPRTYGGGYDPGSFNGPFGLYKVKLTSGGPIQVWAGRDVSGARSGGLSIHASSPAGQPAGTEFWLHAASGEAATCTPPVMGLVAFCPQPGRVATLVSGDSYFAAYTTTGPDQAVVFQGLTPPAGGARRNWKLTVAGGSPVTVQSSGCGLERDNRIPPFLTAGNRYRIIAPAVAYAGQSFWITVVALDAAGATKADYSGTTEFTSPDPGAKIEGVAMDSFSYAWAPAGDQGVRLFVNVVVDRLGPQAICAMDGLDGSIMGLGSVMVVAADVKLAKEPALAVGGIGDTMRFRISWSNYSSASASNCVITEALPPGAVYVPDSLSTTLEGASAPLTYGVDWVAAYSTSTNVADPSPASFVTTGGAPPDNARWLRWTLATVGVNTSGTFFYRFRYDEKANDVVLAGRGTSATMTTGSQPASVTYSATARVLLVNPLVHIWKENAPTYVMAMGGLVTFLISFSNAGSNSAFNVNILDRLPNNSFWLPASYSGWYRDLGGAATPLTFHYCAGAGCTANSGPWVGPDPDGPPAGTWDNGTTPVYLRWVTGQGQGLGPGTSGCIMFTLSIG